MGEGQGKERKKRGEGVVAYFCTSYELPKKIREPHGPIFIILQAKFVQKAERKKKKKPNKKARQVVDQKQYEKR